MTRSLNHCGTLALCWVLTGSAGFAQSTAPAPSQTSNAATAPSPPPSQDNSAKSKKKPKKVWTEDDISKVDKGGVSVVGDSSPSSASKSSAELSGTKSDNSAQSREVEHYRNQLRQLQAQLDAADKKIDDLRNFKGDNAAVSGGINPNNDYSMTPVADQIKHLEDQKKKIQDKMDAVTDEARRKGIEPGQLR